MKTFKDLSSVAKKEIKEKYTDVSQEFPHMKMKYDDFEGRLAKQSLYKVHKYSKDLFEMLDDQSELETWVQDKISKACSNLSSVKYYLDYEMENGSEDNPYEEYEYDDEDMIEDIHHINDLIPLLKQIYKAQKSHKISLKDDIQVIVDPDDAKALYEMYKTLNEKNKKEFSEKLFESKKDFWNMVSFSRSRGE